MSAVQDGGGGGISALTAKILAQAKNAAKLAGQRMGLAKRNDQARQRHMGGQMASLVSGFKQSRAKGLKSRKKGRAGEAEGSEDAQKSAKARRTAFPPIERVREGTEQAKQHLPKLFKQGSLKSNQKFSEEQLTELLDRLPRIANQEDFKLENLVKTISETLRDIPGPSDAKIGKADVDALFDGLIEVLSGAQEDLGTDFSALIDKIKEARDQNGEELLKKMASILTSDKVEIDDQTRTQQQNLASNCGNNLENPPVAYQHTMSVVDPDGTSSPEERTKTIQRLMAALGESIRPSEQTLTEGGSLHAGPSTEEQESRAKEEFQRSTSLADEALKKAEKDARPPLREDSVDTGGISER